MVERYGIQDHSPQLIQHALQNPTAQGNVHNLGGGGDDAYASTSGWATQTSSDSGPVSPAFTYPAAPPSRGFVLPVILALAFGPFGLLYTTWRGGIALIALMVLAGRIRGGSMEAVSSDTVMQPIWAAGVAISVVWTCLAVMAYNRRHKEAYDARKAQEKERAS